MTRIDLADAMHVEFAVLYMTILGAINIILEYDDELDVYGLLYQYQRTRTMFENINHLEEKDDKQDDKK